jgi:hypothetical protein
MMSVSIDVHNCVTHPIVHHMIPCHVISSYCAKYGFKINCTHFIL